MHKMRTISVDDLGVCQSVTRLCRANTAERIEVLLGVETWDPRNIVLDRSPDFDPRIRCGLRQKI